MCVALIALRPHGVVVSHRPEILAALYVPRKAFRMVMRRQTSSNSRRNIGIIPARRFGIAHWPLAASLGRALAASGKA